MGKIYTALGLMSGTSMDGVDASIIQTDGKHEYKAILDKYFQYPKDIYKNLTFLREKIKSANSLKRYQKQIPITISSLFSPDTVSDSRVSTYLTSTVFDATIN